MRYVIFSVLLLLPHALARASGSCCVLSLNSYDRPTLVLIASTAQSHEHFAGNVYDLSQQAMILKGSYPLSEHVFVSLQVGLPVSTVLSSPTRSSKGTMGYLYGAGIGFVAPEILGPINLIGALSYSRSHGFVNDSVTRNERTFLISEVQGSVVAEVNMFDDVGLYGGARLYSGKNQLRGGGAVLSGEREGSLSPFVGLQIVPWESVGFTAEGTFGHTRVASIAVALRF